jgi:hypothetical protein
MRRLWVPLLHFYNWVFRRGLNAGVVPREELDAKIRAWVEFKRLHTRAMDARRAGRL